METVYKDRMINCVKCCEKSSKATTDMLPLLGERNKSLATFRSAVSVLFQCCDLDDMLIDKYCKNCES